MGSTIKILCSIVLIITANVVNASPRNVGTFKEVPRCVMSNFIRFLFQYSLLPNSSNDFCDEVDHKMRNIGYLMKGYDIYFGNPLSGVSDPGMRDPIFEASYDGRTTPDGRYCVPGMEQDSKYISLYLID